MKQVSLQSRFLFVLFALGALQLLEGLFRKLITLLRIVLVLLSLWLAVRQSNPIMSTNGAGFEWVGGNIQDTKGKIKEFFTSRVTRLVINCLQSYLRKGKSETRCRTAEIDEARREV
ncbi:hypothetical protein AUP68_15619 [Ilyonectria robusta]